MDAVALIERLVAGDALQQKRHERARDTSRPAPDTPCEKRRCSRGRSSAALPCRRESRVMPRACARSMICARLRCSSLGRQPAQAVVAAERDNQDPDVAVERPVEPRQAAGRRVARHAGVDDFVVEPGGVETFLQQRRIRRALGEPRPAVRLSPSTTIRAAGGAAPAPAARASGCRRRRRATSARARVVAIVVARAHAVTPAHRDQSREPHRSLCYDAGLRGNDSSVRGRVVRDRCSIDYASCFSRAAIASASIRWWAGVRAGGEIRAWRAPARARSSARSPARRAPQAVKARPSASRARSPPAGTRRPCSRNLAPYDRLQYSIEMHSAHELTDALAGARRGHQTRSPRRLAAPESPRPTLCRRERRRRTRRPQLVAARPGQRGAPTRRRRRKSPTASAG